MDYKDYERDVIANADHFTACCFMGRAQYDTRTAKTLAAATRKALTILKERAAAGLPKRGVLLYAVRGSNSVVAGTVQP